MSSSRLASSLRRTGPALAALLMAGCATTGLPPLEATSRQVDLERFMGDWYVHAAIPIDSFIASEAEAYNGIESYRLDEKGRIQTTYTFRDGGFDGPEKRLTPVARVHDTQTNAEWRMQFVWPFRAAYLIVHVDDDYQETIIGVPDRSYVWVMTRSPDLSEERYQALVQRVAETGHDLDKLRRVPHRWPAGAAGAAEAAAASDDGG